MTVWFKVWLLILKAWLIIIRQLNSMGNIYTRDAHIVWLGSESCRETTSNQTWMHQGQRKLQAKLLCIPRFYFLHHEWGCSTAKRPNPLQRKQCSTNYTSFISYTSLLTKPAANPRNTKTTKKLLIVQKVETKPSKHDQCCKRKSVDASITIARSGYISYGIRRRDSFLLTSICTVQNCWHVSSRPADF